jgi:hypothetical protein
MRSSLASLVFMTIAIALASACQSPAPPAAVAAPGAVPAEVLIPTVVCERGCSVGYDSCLDNPQGTINGVKAGGHSDPAAAPNPDEVCPDQLKACLRRCLS